MYHLAKLIHPSLKLIQIMYILDIFVSQIGLYKSLKLSIQRRRSKNQNDLQWSVYGTGPSTDYRFK